MGCISLSFCLCPASDPCGEEEWPWGPASIRVTHPELMAMERFQVHLGHHSFPGTARSERLPPLPGTPNAGLEPLQADLGTGQRRARNCRAGREGMCPWKTPGQSMEADSRPDAGFLLRECPHSPCTPACWERHCLRLLPREVACHAQPLGTVTWPDAFGMSWAEAQGLEPRSPDFPPQQLKRKRGKASAGLRCQAIKPGRTWGLGKCGLRFFCPSLVGAQLLQRLGLLPRQDQAGF